MLLKQLFTDPVHLCSRLFDRHSRLQTRDYVSGVSHIAVFPAEWAHQPPKRRWSLVHEALRYHSDNCVWNIVKTDLFTDYIRIAAEVLLPECVTNHENGSRTDLVVFGSEVT